MMLKLVQLLLAQATKDAGYGSASPEVGVAKVLSHGDYTCSIALTLAKTHKENPMDIAASIVAKFPPSDLIEKVVHVAPGFVNIFIKTGKLLESIAKSPDTPYESQPQSGKKIMVEYTDPNPFKEFHIGHLYSNTVGESLARLLESQGADVRRVCYQGDVGIHVACSVWGMTKKVLSSKFHVPSEETEDRLNEFKKKDPGTRVAWLGACYAHGATAYKEDENAKKEIQILNAQIFLAAQEMHKRNKGDFAPVVDYRSLFADEVLPQDLVSVLYETGRSWTLERFEEIYKILGTKFEDYYFESEVGEYGYKLVKEHISDGIFEESNGAVVFPGEKYGLHTRVLINSLGLPTYEAKELGLNPKKYRDWSFDKSIIVTANEIDEYFKVILKAMNLVAKEVAEKTTHISHGVVRLPEGKMSSRTGKIISGEWLIGEAKTRLSKIVAENSRIEEDQKEETLNKLAIASIKYALIKSSIGKDIVFDFEESLSFEGNSGPYLLYTIVRCNSILSKAGHNGTFAASHIPPNASPDDISLLRYLAKYEESLSTAAGKLAPHILCTYLYNLAKEFSSYYEKINILKSEGGLRSLRLFLINKVRETLVKGINTLGFSEVERM